MEVGGIIARPSHLYSRMRRVGETGLLGLMSYDVE